MAIDNNTSSATEQTLRIFRIHYCIRDGEYEYGDCVTARLPREPKTAQELVEAVLYNWLLDPSDEEEQRDVARCVKEYEQEGYFELPNDYRLVDQLYVMQADPLIDIIHELVNALESAVIDTDMQLSVKQRQARKQYYLSAIAKAEGY
ncbi:hypothetical protein V202x_43050 [Gimesia aquarii]|uniref:Uncharacterized protein n=2 Tax=Gimesia aquarii TaxID=2527964 RepID=A0A517X065_9PLAN|nr:hypothetical protein V202x_43050 [Gimesia aquarii]